VWAVALLIVLSLRAVVWMLGDWLFGQRSLLSVRFVAHVVICAASLASAVGLLLVQSWARWMALGLCSGYSLLLIASLIAEWAKLGWNGIGLGRTVAVVLEAVAVACACWWYLTRPKVLLLFEHSPG
jgi:hypothetical protein